MGHLYHFDIFRHTQTVEPLKLVSFKASPSFLLVKLLRKGKLLRLCSIGSIAWEVGIGYMV